MRLVRIYKPGNPLGPRPKFKLRRYHWQSRLKVGSSGYGLPSDSTETILPYGVLV
jgi:hypothetical protein